MTKKTLAIEAAPEAIPPKPNMAAMMAITKKVTVQRNIIVDFRIIKFYFRTNFNKENSMPHQPNPL